MIIGNISVAEDGRERVRFGSVSVPRRMRYMIKGGETEPTLHAVFEIRDGRPQCISVHIDATSNGRGIGPGDLSLPALPNLSREVFERAAMIFSRTGEDELPDWWSNPRGTIRDALSGTDSELKQVAEIYQLNAAHHPRDAVAEQMGWSWRTASRRIKAARDKGYLPPVGNSPEG